MNTQTNNTHKIKATSTQLNEMLEYYQGYLTYNSSNYIIARAKLTNATITFYRTNVVLFQGTNEVQEYNYWAQKYGIPVHIFWRRIRSGTGNSGRVNIGTITIPINTWRRVVKIERYP